MNPARLWPLAIVAVLGVTVVANVALYMTANGHDAPVPEPDYYRRAIAWDSTLAEARRSAELGWSVDARLATDGDGGTTMELVAQGRDGRPVSNAEVTVTAIHSRPPQRVVEARGTLGADGRARILLPLERSGAWELRLRLRRGDDVCVADLRRELESTPR